MSSLLVYAPALEHTWSEHPESAQRLRAIRKHLEARGLWDRLTSIEPVPASRAQIESVHDGHMVARIEQIAAQGGGLLDGDTYVTPESFRLAELAAGGCCRAVDEVLRGHVHNGLALVRPPGHHAERGRSGGFCLFNNIAIAARHAQQTYGLSRVMIVDCDVHHGNGTQDIFYEDPSVLFVSVHLHMPMVFYPGTGASHETGRGPGKGYNVNVPLPPYVGEKGYERVFAEVIWPRATSFRPELLLVSIGFDAHWSDPLSVAGLTLTGYGGIVRELLAIADSLCGGRVLFVLEGGYQMKALACGVANTAEALLGGTRLEDPLGPMPRPEASIDDLIDDVRRRLVLV